jgi:hypothetical protein
MDLRKKKEHEDEFHNEKLRKLCSLSCIIRVIKGGTVGLREIGGERSLRRNRCLNITSDIHYVACLYVNYLQTYALNMLMRRQSGMLGCVKQVKYETRVDVY